MAIRRVRAIWGFCFCLVVGSSQLAHSQVSYDRMHLSQSSAPSLLSYGVGQSEGASQDPLQNLPADYFESGTTTTSVAKASSARDSSQSRRYGNLVVLGCLAFSFGLGLIITLTTIRRQSAGAAPRPLF